MSGLSGKTPDCKDWLIITLNKELSARVHPNIHGLSVLCKTDCKKINWAEQIAMEGRKFSHNWIKGDSNSSSKTTDLKPHLRKEKSLQNV